MAVLKINGDEILAPSDIQIGIMDLSKAERNAKGKMIIERIATKRKLEISYSYVSKPELSELLQVLSSDVFFTVTYHDPLTGSTRTGTFYIGDRNVGIIDFINGQPRYKDVKFSLIER